VGHTSLGSGNPRGISKSQCFKGITGVGGTKPHNLFMVKAKWINGRGDKRKPLPAVTGGGDFLSIFATYDWGVNLTPSRVNKRGG